MGRHAMGKQVAGQAVQQAANGAGADAFGVAGERVHAVVKLSYQNAHEFYAATTTGELCCGGVFFATPAPPAPGTELTLVLTFPDGRRVQADGRVRWVRTMEFATDELPAGCGVAWTVKGPRPARAIRRFVTESGMRPLSA